MLDLEKVLEMNESVGFVNGQKILVDIKGHEVAAIYIGAASQDTHAVVEYFDSRYHLITKRVRVEAVHVMDDNFVPGPLYAFAGCND